MSSLASYQIIIVVIPEPKICFHVLASSADVSVVSLNDIKTLLSDVLRATFIKGYPDFSNGWRTLPRNPPKRTILDSWFFDNFTLVDELLGNALQILKTCLSVNNNLFGKFVSLLEPSITFCETFKTFLLRSLFLILIY